MHVVDADESLARATGERLGVEWGTSYEDLVADPEVDGVVIATPTPLHVEMIEGAAAKGKHVFCEKPISLDLPSTLAAVETACNGNDILQVGLHDSGSIPIGRPLPSGSGPESWATSTCSGRRFGTGSHRRSTTSESPAASSSTSRSTTLTQHAGSSVRSRR